MVSSLDSKVQAVQWKKDRCCLLDQRRLPETIEYLDYQTADAVAQAIQDMVVRGAPAIGIAAAYGAVLAARSAYSNSGADWRQAIRHDLDGLADARPTAVNLHWALKRMCVRMESLVADSNPEPDLLDEALAIHREDIAANHRIGELGAEMIGNAEAVLTHCNAGALATGGYGTALGVIRSLYHRGNLNMVYAGETRPWLQGARLTAWELAQDAIPVTLIADTAASHLLSLGEVGWIVVGADRIAANGDVANKIGTYQLALSARYHGVKFMVAAPCSTVDLDMLTGRDIPIEQRSESELFTIAGQPIAAQNSAAFNPVFDVTPAELVDAIITEKGGIERPDTAKIRALFQ